MKLYNTSINHMRSYEEIGCERLSQRSQAVREAKQKIPMLSSSIQ